MRRALQGVVVAGVLAIGGLTGLGTSSAQAQGFGAKGTQALLAALTRIAAQD